MPRLPLRFCADAVDRPGIHVNISSVQHETDYRHASWSRSTTPSWRHSGGASTRARGLGQVSGGKRTWDGAGSGGAAAADESSDGKGWGTIVTVAGPDA